METLVRLEKIKEIRMDTKRPYMQFSKDLKFMSVLTICKNDYKCYEIYDNQKNRFLFEINDVRGIQLSSYSQRVIINDLNDQIILYDLETNEIIF